MYKSTQYTLKIPWNRESYCFLVREHWSWHAHGIQTTHGYNPSHTSIQSIIHPTVLSLYSFYPPPSHPIPSPHLTLLCISSCRLSREKNLLCRMSLWNTYSVSQWRALLISMFYVSHEHGEQLHDNSVSVLFQAYVNREWSKQSSIYANVPALVFSRSAGHLHTRCKRLLSQTVRVGEK